LLRGVSKKLVCFAGSAESAVLLLAQRQRRWRRSSGGSGGSGSGGSGGGSGEVLVYNIRNEVKNEVRK